MIKPFGRIADPDLRDKSNFCSQMQKRETEPEDTAAVLRLSRLDSYRLGLRVVARWDCC